MSDKRKNTGCGCLAVLIVIGIVIVSLKNRDEESSQQSSSVPASSGADPQTSVPLDSGPTSRIPASSGTPSKATPAPTQSLPLTLKQLTRSDFPASLILKKPTSFESKIGDIVKQVSIPAGTLVRLESIHDSDAMVNYNNVRLTVRIDDTDLLERATRQRALNEDAARQHAEQVERERAVQEAMQRQAIAESRREAEMAQRAKDEEQKRKMDRIGTEPVPNALDGSYSAVKTFLKDTLNDPDSLKVYNSTKPYFTDDGWVVGCDYGAKNAFGGMVRKENWFVIQNGKVVVQKEWYQYSFK